MAESLAISVCGYWGNGWPRGFAEMVSSLLAWGCSADRKSRIGGNRTGDQTSSGGTGSGPAGDNRGLSSEEGRGDRPSTTRRLMAHFGIDPWNDELALRVEHAKQVLLAMRGESLFESDHFPERGER